MHRVTYANGLDIEWTNKEYRRLKKAREMREKRYRRNGHYHKPPIPTVLIPLMKETSGAIKSTRDIFFCKHYNKSLDASEIAAIFNIKPRRAINIASELRARGYDIPRKSGRKKK